MKKNSATAFAPATTGNVGVGFDVLGVALDCIGDTVTVIKTSNVGVIEISGLSGTAIPLAPEKNTATAGLLQMIRDLALPFGFKVRIKKGIPLGSGMGGSAASAVAGVVAANALLKKPLSKQELLNYALIGESVATGSVHADNVAPCLFGGLVLVQATEPLNIVSIPFPAKLELVVVLPNARLDTKRARSVLRPEASLKIFVEQSANLAGFIAGCFQKDLKLIGSSLKDVLIEPQRAHLIAGFHDVKTAAIQAGALGCGISGAGPAVFAIVEKSTGGKVKRAMLAAFNAAGSGPARGWISPINKEGAYLV